MSKKLIGVLPKNKEYKILSVKHLGLDSCATCDNCNKAIANIVEIQDNDNKIYYVGLDCASTLESLSKLDLDYYSDCVKEARSIRNSILKFIRSKSHVQVNLSFYSFCNDKNFWKESQSGGYQIHVNYSVNPAQTDLGICEKFRTFNKELWNNFIYPIIKDIVI